MMGFICNLLISDGNKNLYMIFDNGFVAKFLMKEMEVSDDFCLNLKGSGIYSWDITIDDKYIFLGDIEGNFMKILQTKKTNFL